MFAALSKYMDIKTIDNFYELAVVATAQSLATANPQVHLPNSSRSQTAGNVVQRWLQLPTAWKQLLRNICILAALSAHTNIDTKQYYTSED